MYFSLLTNGWSYVAFDEGFALEKEQRFIFFKMFIFITNSARIYIQHAIYLLFFILRNVFCSTLLAFGMDGSKILAASKM